MEVYWGAKVESIPSQFSKTPEEFMKEGIGIIHIAKVVIDGEYVGHLEWNGKELSIVKRKPS